MVGTIVQVGITYTEEQYRNLAPSAVALADAALRREWYKREYVSARTRGDVRAREFGMMRDSYRDAKRKFREALAKYGEAKKGL